MLTTIYEPAGGFMKRAAMASLLVIGSVGLSPQKATFEVVSLKRNVLHETPTRAPYIVGGRLQMTNVTLNDLMLPAYWAGTQLAPSQIVGGPDWVSTESYDVTATVGAEFTGKKAGQMQPTGQLMLQSLLEDRFKLAVHWEKRDLPGYALVMSRSDGTLGPRLQRPSPGCQRPSDTCSLHVAPGWLSMGSLPLAALVNYLSRDVVRTVIDDRTGLSGRFALTLEWFTPDLCCQGNRPSIFTALQQQLGLSLEPTKEPVDVVVIDHVEEPTLD
jgi:uncharacterized protein (TIGR03435 family)